MYLDRFMVLTVSQSQPSGHILISAADGISAFNVALVGVAKTFTCICCIITIITVLNNSLYMGEYIHKPGPGLQFPYQNAC